MALLNYLLWFGWDQHRDVHPDGSVSGPYEVWQGIGLGLGIIAITALAGWRRHPILAVLLIPTTTTLALSVDWATDDDSDGLWAVGAFLFFVSSIAGVAVVVGIATAASRLREHSGRLTQ
ncbi:hypothetical protein SMC26_40675 [Actinomadura fulvescens]